MATKKPKHDEVVKTATESWPAADDDVRKEQSTTLLLKVYKYLYYRVIASVSEAI